MRLTIAFSWAAWLWVNTAWIVLWNLLAQKWYDIVWNKQYASVIKWDNNLFVLYISDEWFFVSDTIDLFVSYDKFWIEKNQKVYQISQILELQMQKDLFLNSISIWAAAKLLSISLDEIIATITSSVKKDLEKNIESIKFWYGLVSESKYDLSKTFWTPKKLFFGNEITWIGAIASGLDFYAAYPMTPASTLINVITKNKDVTFFQWEDEIAVAMAMLGAKFAWSRSMCGTSGWWFALMTESISFSAIAEIWWVYILSQRAWPSTWTPTFTEQADIEYALNCAFWDVKPIVICPSSFESGYNLIWKSLNWSDVYQHPVVFLIDKDFSETYISIDENKLIPEGVDRWRLLENGKSEFARYALTDDWISEYTIPGTKDWEFITSSYEHDEYGVSIDDHKLKEKFTQKRHIKLDTFAQNEFNENYYWYEIINPNAKKYFVSLGFNRYVLEWFVSNNKDWWVIFVHNIYPLDFRLKDFFEKNFDNIDKLVFVEQNYSWQLENHIVKSFDMNNDKWKNKITNNRKYALYPIFENELWEKIS